jgi:hypothetical protein
MVIEGFSDSAETCGVLRSLVEAILFDISITLSGQLMPYWWRESLVLSQCPAAKMAGCSGALRGNACCDFSWTAHTGKCNRFIVVAQPQTEASQYDQS